VAEPEEAGKHHRGARVVLATADRHISGFNSSWRKKKAPPAIASNTPVPLPDAFLPEKNRIGKTNNNTIAFEGLGEDPTPLDLSREKQKLHSPKQTRR
jgi:hypothetical protein